MKGSFVISSWNEGQCHNNRSCSLNSASGIAALVVDAGLLYYTKVFLSNAADAAALAGVQELPKNPTDAQNTAISYATDNGVDEGSVTAEILPDGRTIKSPHPKLSHWVLRGCLDFLKLT